MAPLNLLLTQGRCDMKKTIGRTLLIIGFVASGFVLLWNLPYERPDLKKCIRAKLMIPYGGGYSDAGDMELCGKDFSFSNLYGPSFEVHINGLKRDNQDLKEELAQCKSRIGV